MCRRILFVSHTCYFDSHNGASVASRSLMECLARQGLTAEVLSGTVLEVGQDIDIGKWIDNQGLHFEHGHGGANSTYLKGRVGGVDITLHKSTATFPHLPDEMESRGFLRCFREIVDRFHPDVVVNYGGDALAAEVRRVARSEGAAVVFVLHNFNYRHASPFADTDTIIVPSRFAGSFYHKSLGLVCKPLPYLIDFERARVAHRDARYVTFVNPSAEKGVYVFARLADELGRRRPDIPLLVVEGRGMEQTLVDCGIDLRVHGNVHMMSHTSDPRRFWGVTKICLLPSLWWENQPLVAIEAMINGIPVIGSDRGGIPEALGDSGIVLGLPPRMTPATRELPTAMELEPWVKAIISLWDEPGWFAKMSEKAFTEAQRWAPEVLEPQYVQFFNDIRPRPKLSSPRPSNFSLSKGQISTQEPPPEGTKKHPRSDRPADTIAKTAVRWATPATAWHQIPGFFDYEPVYDVAVDSAATGAIFVEIGCLVGRSTCYLAAKIKKAEKDITLYAVDTGRGSPTDVTGWEIAPALGGIYSGILHRNIVECGLADIVIPILTESVRASRLFRDDSIDFCFIDGDHSVESVLADIRAWWPKVRPGGVLAGHDYRRGDIWGEGVTQAVHEFFRLKESHHPACPHCWSVMKPSAR